MSHRKQAASDAAPRPVCVWIPPPEQLPTRRPLVEIGWVVLGHFDPIDEAAIRKAREQVRTYLRLALPDFSWRVPLVLRSEPAPGTAQVAPIRLIDQAVAERQTKGWDFAVAFTASDLHALRKSYTFGTPSQGPDAAAISTARLDPTAQRAMYNKSERELLLTRRIRALFYHLLGDLVGLSHSDDPHSPMFQPQLPEDLDAVDGFQPDELARLANRLGEVADLRLEESSRAPHGRLRFTLRVILRAGDEIGAAVWRNRPWTLVWHLSKFTTAALSSLAVLILTAEVWDVGVRLPLAGVATTLLVVLLGTTYFVVTRQRLLTRRAHVRLTEQIVVTDLAIILTVLGAMTALSLLLLALSLLIVWVMPEVLVQRWTEISVLTWDHNLALAGMVTIIGLLIGALGASIEDQNTFRQVAFIDEEI